ncbi:MAG: cytochrome c3 family protein [Bacteroidales bacterium]|nr:cytochrome c3 family protein [Bacteroidales bacterium]MCB8999679.1 cytochrome c3 family protein [Bacteroidales bacterium]
MNNHLAGKISRVLLLLILSIFTFTPALFSSDSPADSSLATANEGHERENLIRGERLFYGLVYQREKSVNCQACHNTGYIDTLNWNPSAYDISVKYEGKSVKDLATVLLKPRAEKMMEVHKGFDLSDEDISQLKTFMDTVAVKGLKPQKTTINKLIIFIIVSLLLLFSLVDLVIIKKLKYQWINLIIILAAGVYITDSLVNNAIAIGRSPDYSPDQPIKFSHKVHAGQNQTNCLYCHSSAESSKSAGIPSASVCMNCHLIVRNGSRSGAFEIAKVIDAYEKGKPIDWVRIHNLPDHVYFNHSQHVGVAKLECQECHGPVQEMDRVVKVTDLSMGWCISCHRQKQVSFHDNKFYEVYRDKVEKMNSGSIDSVTVEMVGGTECMKCHY